MRSYLFCLLSLTLFLSGCLQDFKSETCSDEYQITLIERGDLKSDDGSAATDILFLDNENLLIASLPGKGKEKTKLKIFTNDEGFWKFNYGKSVNLPEVFHPRQIIKADLDGDRIEDVLISDHGTDKHPFPGSHPVILKLKNNNWEYDKSSEQIKKTYNFNTAYLPDNNYPGMYLGKVFRPGDPFYYVWKNNKWVNHSAEMPPEIDELCYMTAISGDFDHNGTLDLFLGGCDIPEPKSAQARDLVITKLNSKWSLVKSEKIPIRPENSTWGTVFLKTFSFEGDKKTDLLVATHDHGFHRWQAYILKNTSKGHGQFSFKKILFPIKQEENTEGYVNSIEDFKVNGGDKAYLIEVRSVLRNQDFKHPEYGTRLVVQENINLKDISGCLPSPMKKESFRMKRLPSDPSKILLVPYSGKIYELSLSKKVK